MPEENAPADVARAVAAGVCRLILGGLGEDEKEALLDEMADRYAERTDVRHPLAPLGGKPLLTRDDLRRHFAASAGGPSGIERFEAVGQIHETKDPELVMYEFAYVGTAGGEPFEVPCLNVTRVRDGRIVESRDYVDHIGMARVLGRLPALAEALGSPRGSTLSQGPSGRIGP